MITCLHALTPRSPVARFLFHTMAEQRPAWQTDDLQDEWIDPTDHDNQQGQDDTFSSLSQGTRSISMTTPIAGTFNVITSFFDNTTDNNPDPTTTSQAGGTFLVRQDLPALPLLPQTPGRNNKKGLIKDFFSPSPLERLFEPPSPPAQKPSIPNQPPISSRLTQEYVPEESSTEVEDHSHREAGIHNFKPPNMEAFNNHQFTFNVPRISSGNDGVVQVQSTPNPRGAQSQPPMTDPRLKLFQFQYDTFTRDHLSAIVDSIAANTPSDGSRPPTLSNGSSYISERKHLNNSHLRSAKRVKLSPPSDYGEGDGEGASIARPKIVGKDYVGESRKMMEQIKSAKDFSTITSVASVQPGEVASPEAGGHRVEAKAEGTYFKDLD